MAVAPLPDAETGFEDQIKAVTEAEAERVAARYDQVKADLIKLRMRADQVERVLGQLGLSTPARLRAVIEDTAMPDASLLRPTKPWTPTPTPTPPRAVPPVAPEPPPVREPARRAEAPPAPPAPKPTPPAPAAPPKAAAAPQAPPEPPADRPTRLGVAKVTDREARAWIKEVGIFTSKRFQDHFGLKSTSTHYTAPLVEKGFLRRHGGKRGPGVFFTHKDYVGPLDLTTARAGVPLRHNAGTAPPVTSPPPTRPPVGNVPTADARPQMSAVRNAIVGPIREAGKPFSIKELAEPREWNVDVTRYRVQELVRQGKVNDVSVQGGPEIYEYVKPNGPGAAAKLDQARRPRENPATVPRGDHNASGRRIRANNDKVQQLLDLVYDAGGWAEPAANGHFKCFSKDGKNHIDIAATPRGARTVANDRSRLRRAKIIDY